MQNASEKFIEIFQEDFISKHASRKEAYEATCSHWRKIYQFQEPITSYDSFKKMLNYYHNKPTEEYTIKGIDW